MTFPMYVEFVRFWKVYPPEAALLAAIARYEAEQPGSTDKDKLVNELSQLSGGKVKVKA